MNEQLPDGWVEVKFTDVFDIQGGTQPPKSDFVYEPKDGYVRLLQIRDFGEKPTPTYVSRENNLKFCREDDILIARYGASIGRIVTGMAGVYNVALAKVIIPESIHKRYAYHLLKSKFFQEPILEIERSAQDGFNKDDLTKIILPIAPFTEQVRIVTVLDGLLERVRLVQEQLSEIDKIENKLLRTYITNDDNELLPSVKLGQYCEEVTKRIGSDWPGKRLVGVSKEDGITDLRVGTKASFENYKIVQPKDFVYNPMRVDIGSIALYEDETVAITSPDYVVFRVKHTLSSLLLLKFLKSELGLAEINNNTQGSVRSRLYFDNLCKINFPLGEEVDQNQAQKLFSILERLSRQRKGLDKKLDFMKQGFLAKAFAGELTQQEPTDEPASALLERIQTEQLAEQQRPKEKRKIVGLESKRYKKMAEQLRSIKEILTDTNTLVSARTVWQQSVHKDDIEAFYNDLKHLVDEEKSVVEVREDNQSFLTLSNAN